jgi:hypothetical protein
MLSLAQATLSVKSFVKVVNVRIVLPHARNEIAIFFFIGAYTLPDFLFTCGSPARQLQSSFVFQSAFFGQRKAEVLAPSTRDGVAAK